MDGKNWMEWTGKKIFLRTRNDRVYSGNVSSVEKQGPYYFINFVDKFGHNISIINSEISEIKEEL